MPEIKVIKSEVEPVFQNLKEKTNELDTTNPKVEFSESKLDFIKKMEEIEEQYYETIKSFKTFLIKTNNDAWSSIESYIKLDQNLARSIHKEKAQ
ncbi:MULTISPECIES: YwqI/YxiC family protein [Heyndrickxia]|uniref:YwqI/YxiC family protein n=1 Tax=Heyndrickxia TaxID=2837504 RepID=UPI000D3C7E99|nr:YwqI/YxiC family protein [Heyndrickxia sporothermodurans]PTY77591.1 hypothetical protein B5V89_14170 [Heyndrickxia sporothermodurans]